MPSKNNYRETIIKQRAQLKFAVESLNKLDPTRDWEKELDVVQASPEYREALLKEFKSNARSNLKPGLGRKPTKTVIINGKETTYAQAAADAGVSVPAIHNRLKRERKKSESRIRTDAGYLWEGSGFSIFEANVPPGLSNSESRQN